MSKCKINFFCYVCGRYLEHGISTFSPHFHHLYEVYFQPHTVIESILVPNKACKTCYNNLLAWSKDESNEARMPFGVPMLWLNSAEHVEESCHGCLNYVNGLNAKKAKNMKYKTVPTVQMPLDHDDDSLPVPTYKMPDTFSFFSDFSDKDFDNEETASLTPTEIAEAAAKSKAPIPVTQKELDVIVAQLGLTKTKSEKLASFLKSKKLLAKGVKVTAYRTREAVLSECFVLNESKDFAYCPDVEILMHEMGISNYIAKE